MNASNICFHFGEIKILTANAQTMGKIRYVDT
jgi:hypothetical protein